MTDIGPISTVNLAGPRVGRAGMTTAQRDAHARLGAQLGQPIVHRRAEQPGRPLKASEVEARAVRAGKGPSRHRGQGIELPGSNPPSKRTRGG